MLDLRSTGRVTAGFALVAACVITGCAASAASPAATTTAAGASFAVSAPPAPPTATSTGPSVSPSAAASASAGASTGTAVLGDILFATKPGAVGGSDIIQAIAADGSRPIRRIGPHGWMPDLAPDGSRIAYTSNLADDAFDLWTMDADGTDATRVTGNDFPTFRPIWSPDGMKLLFSGFPGEIYVIGSDGSGQVRLASNASMGRWSPDGTKIAYIDGRDGNDEIYVMNANGSNPTRLTHDPSGDGIPSWSPDGKRIAFSSDRTGAGDIYVMDADGRDAKRVTTDPDVEGWPIWSPDGRSIAFDRRASANAPADIWVMNADGTGLRNLTNTPADEDSSPSWR